MAAERQPSVIGGALKRPFAEQVAFYRNKLGNLVPTERWDDLIGAAHDSAFMVAGAAKADLLTDLAAAVDRAISEGQSLDTFRADFKAITARHGWTDYTGADTPGGVAWRTRTIIWGNTAPSYAAGRLAQLEEGGFEVWVYRHSESVESPRPLHLAWDGTTLPKSDPWWRTHYPPGGWGCECYVLGARSEAAARRLGGKPGRGAPEGAGQTNPSTGTPVGIDRGWDYQPGATTTDTVRQMADKATAWEHDLARAYLGSVPAGQRDALSSAYRQLPSVARDTRLYAQRIQEERTALEIPPRRTLGLVTALDAEGIAERIGAEVRGFDWGLDAEAVRAIWRAHGDDIAERARGHLRAVEPADFGRLPALIEAPRLLEAGGIGAESGLPLVRLTRPFAAGEELVAEWERRAGLESLALVALYLRAVP